MSLTFAFSQESPSEEDFYTTVTPAVTEGVIPEAGGMTHLPGGRTEKPTVTKLSVTGPIASQLRSVR